MDYFGQLNENERQFIPQRLHLTAERRGLIHAPQYIEGLDAALIFVVREPSRKKGTF